LDSTDNNLAVGYKILIEWMALDVDDAPASD
jgi:hypothetical protein